MTGAANSTRARYRFVPRSAFSRAIVPRSTSRSGETSTLPAACAFTMPVAFPGTRWYSKLEAEGRILDHDPTHYDGHHVVVRPARMSVEELVRGYHRLARRFYSWGPALRRMLRQKLWRQSFGPLQAAAGYTAVSAGYRRFHRRLRRRG